MINHKDYMPILDIAKMFNIHPETLYRWVNSKSKQYREDFTKDCVLRVGNKIFVNRKKFNHWIQKGK